MIRCLLLALCALLPASAVAQEAAELTALGRPATVFAAAEITPGTLTPSELAAAATADLDAGTVAKLSGAGLLGGAVGFFGGAYLGALIADSEDDGLDDLDALHGALIGGTIGESTLLPAGVHLANGRRGNYWISAAASVALAFGGIGLMEAAHWDAPAAPIVAVAVPLAQIATSIAIERSTD